LSGEGEEGWLAKQLDKIIEAAPRLSELKHPSSAAEVQDPPSKGADHSNFTDPLATHIKGKGGESKQVVRFLATADWLRLRGAKTLTAGAVAKALSENHQKKLANAPDCLNKNVTKGFCEKSGEGFFITPQGLKELGHQA
jgi:hypothetical protein